MTKQWQIILIILGILVVLYVIDNYGQQKLSTSTDSIFPFEKDDVYSFRISKGVDLLELTRSDSIWAISGHDSLTVKPVILDNFFEKSLKVKRESLISKNPDKWGTYSVDDSTGTQLIIYDEDQSEIGRAVFGRSKSEWSKNFVRIGDEKEVYQTNANIMYQLQTLPTYWGEKPKPPEPAAMDTTDI